MRKNLGGLRLAEEIMGRRGEGGPSIFPRESYGVGLWKSLRR